MFSRNLTSNKIRIYPPLEDDEPPELLDEVIPEDPQLFYESFGHLTHPNTGQPVLSLTDYQYEIWNAKHEYRYRIVLKSQKVGLSTSRIAGRFSICV